MIETISILHSLQLKLETEFKFLLFFAGGTHMQFD